MNEILFEQMKDPQNLNLRPDIRNDLDRMARSRAGSIMSCTDI